MFHRAGSCMPQEDGILRAVMEGLQALNSEGEPESAHLFLPNSWCEPAQEAPADGADAGKGGEQPREHGAGRERSAERDRGEDRNDRGEDRNDRGNQAERDRKDARERASERERGGDRGRRPDRDRNGDADRGRGRDGGRDRDRDRDRDGDRDRTRDWSRR